MAVQSRRRSGCGKRVVGASPFLPFRRLLPLSTGGGKILDELAPRERAACPENPRFGGVDRPATAALPDFETTAPFRQALDGVCRRISLSRRPSHQAPCADGPENR